MSIFRATVDRYMRDEEMVPDEAELAAAEDLRAHSTWGKILDQDPGYLEWAARQDKLDRKHHEEGDA